MTMPHDGHDGAHCEHYDDVIRIMTMPTTVMTTTTTMTMMLIMMPMLRTRTRIRTMMVPMISTTNRNEDDDSDHLTMLGLDKEPGYAQVTPSDTQVTLGLHRG